MNSRGGYCSAGPQLWLDILCAPAADSTGYLSPQLSFSVVSPSASESWAPMQLMARDLWMWEYKGPACLPWLMIKVQAHSGSRTFRRPGWGLCWSVWLPSFPQSVVSRERSRPASLLQAALHLRVLLGRGRNKFLLTPPAWLEWAIPSSKTWGCVVHARTVPPHDPLLLQHPVHVPYRTPYSSGDFEVS